MFKRIVFYSVLFIVMCVGVFEVYISYKPAEANVITNKITYTIPEGCAYTHETIDGYIATSTSEKPVYILFYDENDTASQYVLNNYLEAIQKKYSVSKIENLVFCNLAEFQQESIKQTKVRWGFYYYPTFQAMHISDGTLVLDSTLEWYAANHYYQDDIETWLINNKLITALPSAE